MDIDRVGICRTSAGGQNAAGVLLFQGDFYEAAVASYGCHDNRIDKASWNEQYSKARLENTIGTSGYFHHGGEVTKKRT